MGLFEGQSSLPTSSLPTSDLHCRLLHDKAPLPAALVETCSASRLQQHLQQGSSSAACRWSLDSVPERDRRANPRARPSIVIEKKTSTIGPILRRQASQPNAQSPLRFCLSIARTPVRPPRSGLLRSASRPDGQPLMLMSSIDARFAREGRRRLALLVPKLALGLLCAS